MSVVAHRLSVLALVVLVLVAGCAKPEPPKTIESLKIGGGELFQCYAGWYIWPEAAEYLIAQGYTTGSDGTWQAPGAVCMTHAPDAVSWTSPESIAP